MASKKHWLDENAGAHKDCRWLATTGNKIHMFLGHTWILELFLHAPGHGAIKKHWLDVSAGAHKVSADVR